MKLIKKKCIDVEVQHCCSTEWYGLKWCVLATFRKTFLWFSWNESYEMAGPFRIKQDAKKCAKNLRREYGLSDRYAVRRLDDCLTEHRIKTNHFLPPYIAISICLIVGAAE